MSLEHEIAFVKLNDPPSFKFTAHGADSDPLYYSKNGNYLFILIPPQSANTGKIVKYDMDEQRIVETYKYPSDVYIASELGWIDVENSTIYISSTHHEYSIELLSFNFDTNQWNTSICNNENVMSFPQSIFIQSPVNELHLIDNNTHFKYDKTNKLFIELQNNIGMSQIGLDDGKSIDGAARFIYNKLHKQLMIFQGDLDDILVCKIQDKNQQIFNWEKSEIKLHRKNAFRLYDVLLGWDQIVFWFHFTYDKNNGSIWALDLLHPNKWFQSTCNIPHKCTTIPWPFAINDKQNNVH
eukprot:519169_1